MAPRFMERMARQAETLKTVFGEPQFDPPPYPQGRSSRSTSEASSQYTQYKPLPTPPPQYASVNRPTTGVEQSAIPKDALILVTGANSWQGIHIVDQLLDHGYRVRGTVRDAEKAVWTSKYFKDRYGIGRYTTAIIQDMAKQYAFDIAVRGCSGVIHVASVTSMSPNPNEVITPSIAGATNALEAANKEPNVKRFVYCSSVAAAVSHDRGVRNEISSDSWNMLDFDDAWAPPPYDLDRARSVYASSKMQTEAALWRWYGRRKPLFTLNTVLPDTLWGKILDSRHQGYPSSVGILKSLYDGGPSNFLPCYSVDVQDSALLHVAALVLPDVKGQRIFAASTPWNVQSIVQLLKGLFPQRDIADDVPDLGVDLTVFKEAGRAEELLRRMGKKGWTDQETSIEKTCESFY